MTNSGKMECLSNRLHAKAQEIEGATQNTQGIMPPSKTAALLREAAAAIVRAVEWAAWIPVAERLPEHYEHVEVWPPFEDRTYNFYAHRDGGTNGVKAGNWYHNDREGYDWKISPTHWRPLPPPPLDAADDGRGG